jgi:hypothetical protein
MGTVKSENWDGVTAPNLPTGWTAAAAIQTETTSFNSSANGIYTTSSNAEDVAYWNTNDDGNGGDAQASSWFHNSVHTGGLQGRVYCRMTTPSTALSGVTGYVSSVDFAGNSLRLSKVVGGTLTNLGTRTHTWSIGDKIVLYCRTVGTSIILRCQRVSDGKWLDSADAWQSSVQDTISVTNSVITGVGKAGIGFFQQVAANDIVYADDFLFETVSTRRMTQVISF